MIGLARELPFMHWLWVPVIVVFLIAWRIIEDREKKRERKELITEIRKELDEVKTEIVEEIKSLSVEK
jgi:hypothetical protein